MSFFKKPVVAFICAFLIVFSSTCLSVKVNFEEKCLEVIDGFYDGDLYSGVSETPLASHIVDISNNAYAIAQMAEKSGIDAQDVLWSIDDLQYAMTEYYDDISYVHYCYEQILENVKMLNEQLYAVSLTASEQQELSALNWSISQSVSAVNESAYNESVRIFNRNNMQFPTDFLCELVGIYPPQRFA